MDSSNYMSGGSFELRKVGITKVQIKIIARFARFVTFKVPFFTSNPSPTMRLSSSSRAKINFNRISFPLKRAISLVSAGQIENLVLQASQHEVKALDLPEPLHKSWGGARICPKGG